MIERTPLWPAQLDHIRIDSDDPPRVIDFYRRALGMHPMPLDDGTVLMQAPARRILIGRGRPGAQPFMAFRVQSEDQLDALRTHLAGRNVELHTSPSAVFAAGAFAVRDPDERLVVFGLPRTDLARSEPAEALPAGRLPGRLQHVVVASANLPAMLRFYGEELGFVVSDYVYDGDTRSVGFFRSDPEHHSFGVFRCPETRPDHHAYEASCWNDLRDWADHLSRLDIKLWWGPGRHGPGNNLFFMIKDPQGYLIEISAELEIMPDTLVERSWKHEERTLNLWGSAFMRS